jgi:hypothetical protein
MAYDQHGSQFTDETKLRVPPGFNDVIDNAARAKLTSRSEYIRTAVQDRLKADGFSLTLERLPA